jgi:phosphoglycerol geranylgeranyltransferase
MRAKVVYNNMVSQKANKQKAFAVLVDPDKLDLNAATEIGALCQEANVDYIFFGGSLMVSNHVDICIQRIKLATNIPVVLFPGSPAQVSPYADALLYLSLISGRNADLLIGQHVLSAPLVKQSGLEVVSTGYMVIDGGKPTTVSYMSGSAPIPADKTDIAICTAMAGEMLGNKVIYMDAGSGAKDAISPSMIKAVNTNVQIPVIVGGGIRTADKAYESANAGADIIVIGNAIEKDQSLIAEISAAVHQASNGVVSKM